MQSMENGIILIDKPAGLTSFGVVARLRRVLSQQAGRKLKVGHTGTLDPFATGLMILCVGKECKNSGLYTKHDKVYQAVIKLGSSSTTGDPEGEITVKELNRRPPNRQEVEAVLEKFSGEISQRPPIFSAIKINGQRAYKLARDGQAVEVPERQVTIYSLDIINYDYPNLTIETHVSSGTYIRSLAVDIGEQLGTGAYCQQLRRLAIADYDISQAQTLADYGITS